MKFRVVPLAALLVFMGCGSLPDRSLIFFTHTTVGVEVAIEPNTTAPGRVVIGYKRAEGVLNPVYLPPEDTYDPTTGKWSRATSGGKVNDYYRDQAYSVIAKFAGEGRGRAVAGTSGEATAEAYASMAQWFATGKAADTLASQPGIAGAVTGSPKIAEAAAGERRFSEQFLGLSEDVRLSELMTVYRRLKEWSEAYDTDAASHVAKLNTIAAKAIQPFTGLEGYETSDGKTYRDAVLAPASGADPFDTLLTYQFTTSQWAAEIERILSSNLTALPGRNPDEPLSASEKEKIRKKLNALRDAHATLTQATKSTHVVEAVWYYAQSLVSSSPAP